MNNKLFLIPLLSFLGIHLHAQNVGIGTSTPHASAKLHIESTNKGLLIPRMSLSNVTVAAPVSSPATGLLVFNTNASVIGGNGIGVYYWDATRWVPMSSGMDHDWYEVGTSTAPDNINDNMYHLAGNLGIGTASPISKVHISGASVGIRIDDPAAPNDFMRITDGTGHASFYPVMLGRNLAGFSGLGMVAEIDVASANSLSGFGINMPIMIFQSRYDNSASIVGTPLSRAAFGWTTNTLSSNIPIFYMTLSNNGQLAIKPGVAGGSGLGDNSAQLDVESSNKGVLHPRIALLGATDITTIPSPATSLMIYNTATAGVGINAVSPGHYYWNGTRWLRFSSGNPGWELLGNAGTSAATNFVGTTDAVDFVTRTNNTEVMRATSAGRVGVGITSPTTKLEVLSGTGDAVFGHSNNVGGYLGYETNFSIGTPPQSLNGAGVWASNPAAGYTSIFAQSSGSATVAAAINYSNVWMASYNYVDNASNTLSPSASYNQLNVTSTTLSSTQSALRGYNNRGTTAGNPGYSIGVEGTADAQNQDAMGVQGTAFSDGGISAGGYFEGLNYGGTSYAYAYVGGTINSGATARKIVGTGSVSEIIPTPNHGRVTLTCPESPEYWYQDYGTVELVNGKAHVELDPILAEIIVVDAKNPLRVFATPADMLYFNGVTITNQTATSFDLVELNGGNHSGTLHYQLVAKPKTNYGEGRFPQAPGPSWLKADKEPLAAKAANQPQKDQVFHWPADHIQYKYNPEDHFPVGDRIRAGENAGKIRLADGTYTESVPVDNRKVKK